MQFIMLHNHNREALSLIYAKAFKYLIAENYAKIVKGESSRSSVPLGRRLKAVLCKLVEAAAAKTL